MTSALVTASTAGSTVTISPTLLLLLLLSSRVVVVVLPLDLVDVAAAAVVVVVVGVLQVVQVMVLVDAVVQTARRSTVVPSYCRKSRSGGGEGVERAGGEGFQTGGWVGGLRETRRPTKKFLKV